MILSEERLNHDDMRQTIQPDNYFKFRCIASDCEDSCCCGWKIGIDQKTYDRYKANDLPELKDLFEKNLIPHEHFLS